MESEIPGGVPRVLPFVRHGDDVIVIEMHPASVAPAPALRGGAWKGWIASQPLLDHIVIKLLGPEEPGKRLTHNVLCVRRENVGDDRGVELVGLLLARAKDLLKVGPKGVSSG